MIARIIELSVRNRFVVLVVAAALAAFGVYAMLDTPVDAVPDLGENQVIVFTDWPGRAPRRQSPSRHRSCESQDRGVETGPSRRRANRAGLRSHPADQGCHSHAHNRDVARDGNRRIRDFAHPHSCPKCVRDLHHCRCPYSSHSP